MIIKILPGKLVLLYTSYKKNINLTNHITMKQFTGSKEHILWSVPGYLFRQVAKLLLSVTDDSELTVQYNGTDLSLV